MCQPCNLAPKMYSANENTRARRGSFHNTPKKSKNKSVRGTSSPNSGAQRPKSSSPKSMLQSPVHAKTPSPTNIAYAGAKFHDPPAPQVLPKPPTHWVIGSIVPFEHQDISSQLKMMLQVQA